nr:tail fiber assembly protein [Citrobacter tructae]
MGWEKWVHDNGAEKTGKITQAAQLKESILMMGTSKIGPLQDTVDFDISTEVESALLLVWKNIAF